jgi:hypothetical protein
VAKKLTNRVRRRASRRRQKPSLPVRDLMACSERIVLSERDSARVRALLDKPPEPTHALLAAARRRKSGTDS